jgi:hypothetical protein
MTDTILERLSPHFDRAYSSMGRPSIPPEKLLRALLQGLYTERSEGALVSAATDTAERESHWPCWASCRRAAGSRSAAI